MNIKAFVLSIIAWISIYSTCNKNPLGCHDTIAFAIEMKVYPDNETVHVGDTIWLESSSKKIFTDIVSGQVMDFSDAANLGVDINFDQITEDTNHIKKLVPAVQSFQFILLAGKFLPDDLSPERNVDYDYVETDTSYQLKLGLVPKYSGVFMFAPNDAGNVYRKKSRCPKAGFTVTLSNTEQHMDIYASLKKPDLVSASEQRHVYCFNIIK